MQKLLLCLCRGSISGSAGSIQSGEVFAGQRGMTVESLLMSGCGQGCEPQENLMEETLAQVSSASYQQKRKLASFPGLPIASFPGRSRLQFLIASSIKTEGEGLGERVTCVTSGRREGAVPDRCNSQTLR